MFIELLESISGKLLRPTARSHSIPPETHKAVPLQFLSVSRCMTAMCGALTTIIPAYIKVIQEYSLQKYTFPLVFGSIDGSHVAIMAPSTNEDVHVNRKGFHPITFQRQGIIKLLNGGNQA